MYLVVVLIAREKKSPTQQSASQSQTASMMGAVLRQRVRSLEKERWKMKLEVRGQGNKEAERTSYRKCPMSANMSSSIRYLLLTPFYRIIVHGQQV